MMQTSKSGERERMEEEEEEERERGRSHEPMTLCLQAKSAGKEAAAAAAVKEPRDEQQGWCSLKSALETCSVEWGCSSKHQPWQQHQRIYLRQTLEWREFRSPASLSPFFLCCCCSACAGKE